MEKRAPVFRVFISSTFSDLKAERNELQENAFKNLTEYCAIRGGRFQAVDLRWGISEEAGLDHQTMSICMGELQRCKELTPRPNFLILLGDRYGWKPLPVGIQAQEFETILNFLTDDEDIELLKRWYWLDNNAVPPEYVLQPRRGEFEKTETWQKSETCIRATIIKALTVIGWPADDPRWSKYVESATHQEIQKGALASENLGKHVFAYLREIPEPFASPNTNEYFDLKDGQRDREAAKSIRHLKNSVQRQLPSKNVYRYEGRFSEKGLEVDLQALSARVEEDLKKVIDEQFNSLEKQTQLDQEREDQRRFALERSRHFKGHEDVLRKIRLYLSQPDGGNPLFISGASGTGKTALMARAALDAEALVNCKVIFRFIEATPSSSNLRTLLKDLCEELASMTGEERSEKSENTQHLVEEFKQRLKDVRPNKPVVILLDAIDQLGGEGNPELLGWIPSKLKTGVSMVLSVLKRSNELSGRAYDKAREQYRDEKRWISMKPLDGQSSCDLLTAWLYDENRTLKLNQFSGILQKYNEAGKLPLYLKLAFEEAVTWKSYDLDADTHESIPPSITKLLDYRFDQMSRSEQHGEAIVSRVLGLLFAARNGLNESEILNLLASNDEFYNKFMDLAQHTLPQLAVGGRTLPIVFWSRLHFDLRNYLTERYADGTPLYSYYHRLVRETVEARYGEKFECLHAEIGHFFKKQPTRFRDQPNYRKLSEIAFQFRKGEAFSELIEILCNQNFIETMADAGRIMDYVLEAQNSYLLIQKMRPGLDRDAILRALLKYILGKSTNLDPSGLDPERLHAMLIYQPNTVFYRNFLELAANYDNLESQKTLNKADLQSYQTAFIQRLGNYQRRIVGDLQKASETLAPIVPILENQTQGNSQRLKELARLYYDLGYIEYLKGNYNGAVDLIDKSASKASEATDEMGNWISRCVSAAIKFRADQSHSKACLNTCKQAESFFQEKHREDPDNSTSERWIMNTNAHRLEIFCALEKTDSARSVLETLSKNAWAEKFGMEKMRSLWEANVASLEGEHDLAIKKFEDYLKAFPVAEQAKAESFARPWYEFGVALMRSNKKDQAITAFERACSLPDEPGNHLWKEAAANARKAL